LKKKVIYFLRDSWKYELYYLPLGIIKNQSYVSKRIN